MTFRLHHSVNVDRTIDDVWSVFSNPEDIPRVQHILPSCSECTLLHPSSPATSSVTIDSARCLAGLTKDTRPMDLPWPDLRMGMTSDLDGNVRDGSREPRNRDKQICPVHFTFKLGLATVQAVQVADSHVVLFHSRVQAAGIEEFKLRVIARVEGDPDRTSITETVWGTAPALLAGMLRLTGMAARTHRQHMESYSKLFSI